MKKLFVLCGIGLCVALVATSCKSSESAYKKAYEKAKANETVVVEEPTTTVVAPMTEVKAEEKVVDNYDNVNVRQEKLNVLDGNGLKNFSVVVGAFGLKANAEGLMNQLRSQGYAAQLAFNAERNMYRVIASTFDTKNEAAANRDQLRATFPDAWLLYNIK
ncbi:MAG: SPOR domain-containing protein [Prevotella sp.]|nr:SPOR domain-containing protein [Candidatus Equicola stercoris]